MSRARSFRAALFAFAALVAPASSAYAQNCGLLLAMAGRDVETLEDGKPMRVPPFGELDFAGCPPEAIAHFVYDHSAAKAAKPVTDRDQLTGTWVSDNVLAIYAGRVVPVYEMLEIAPGGEDGTVEIRQRAIRAYDPAKAVFIEDDGVNPPVDVEPADLNPLLGEMTATLGEKGLTATRIRTHEVMLESERDTDLAIKMQMLSLYQRYPLAVAAADDHLVFRYFSRLFKPQDRVLTYRRRNPENIGRAVAVSLHAQVSMARFHCFLRVAEMDEETLLDVLGGLDPDAFFAGLAEMEASGKERMRLLDVLKQSEPDSDAYNAAREAMVASMMRDQELLHSGIAEALERTGNDDTVFGCPDYFR